MSANIIDSIFQRARAGVVNLSGDLTEQYSLKALTLVQERLQAGTGLVRVPKFDGCDTGDPGQVKAFQLLHEWDHYLRGEGKFDEADITMAAEGLTHFFTAVYERKFPKLAAFSGLILPISKEVHPGAETYQWWERELLGQAVTASTYDEYSIPMVGGPKATATIGRIKPFLNGYKTNFRTKIREALARKNGKPDFRVDQGKADAAYLGHAEAINALWLWGDLDWGIPGLMKETRIRVIQAPLGLNNSPLWSQKTADEVVFDLMTMANSLHQLSNRTRTARKILLPTLQHDYIAGTPRGSGTDTTILGFVTNALKEKRMPIEFLGLDELNVAKSTAYNGGPPNLVFDRAVIIDTDESAACFELPVAPEQPMAPKQTGLGEVTFMHSRAGGLRLEDAQSIVFFDGF